MFPMKPESREAAEILAIGEMLSEYGGQRHAMDVLSRRGNKIDLMRKINEESRSTPLHKAADRLLGINSERDYEGYSLSRALRAEMNRRFNPKSWDEASLERDISSLSSSEKSGVNSIPNGFFVPLGILARDFNMGASSEAGNLMGYGVDGLRAVDPLRKVSALARLGATYVSGLRVTMSLPRFTSSTAVSFKSEVAPATVVSEETSSLELTPRRLPAVMIFSRQALLQSTPALDASISRHLLAAIMSQMEDSAINADGTGNTPLGLRSTVGVGSVVGGANGAQLTYAHLSDLEDAPGLADVGETDFSGYLLNSKTRRWLRTQPRGTGLPFCWESGSHPLLGHRTAVSNIMPSNLIKGTSGAVCSALAYSADWTQFIVGLYGGGVDITVDPITMADIGKVRITASLLVGVGANLPSAFSIMADAKTV